MRGGLSLLPLLSGALDALAGAAPDLPVVAAGGIATPRAVAACLAAGADAVRCGTVLVATEEADVHPAYAAALVAADGSETVLTTTFGNGWPDAPHRVLRSADDRAMAGEGARSPMFPSRSTDTALVPSMALYAGEGVGAVRAVRPAGEVVTELMTGAAALLDRRH